MTAIGAPEPHVVIARGPPHRATDRHIREIVIALIGLVLGAVGMLANSSRESGATQATIVGMQAQLKETTTELKTSAQNNSNLLNVIQSQAIQVATLTVQVSTLNAQMAALLAQGKK